MYLTGVEQKELTGGDRNRLPGYVDDPLPCLNQANNKGMVNMAAEAAGDMATADDLNAGGKRQSAADNLGMLFFSRHDNPSDFFARSLSDYRNFFSDQGIFEN